MIEQALQPAQPVPWPSGKRAAASFSFDVDAESAILFASPGSEHRSGVMSHQSYGPLVGVPRLLRILDKHRVRSTFFVPGYTAERYPGVVRDITAAGHEIAHHGYLHESLQGVDPVTEAGYLDAGLRALEAVAGVRPVGYRAPMWEPTHATPGLLAERGFAYDSSLMDADVPYPLAVATLAGAGAPTSIIEIPIHWSLDDWEQYCFLPGINEGVIEAPSKVYDLWSAELAALRDEGGCFVLTNHPFITGRASRAAVLDRLIGETVAMGDVWVASLDEVADYVAGLSLPARHVSPPEVPSGYRDANG